MDGKWIASELFALIFKKDQQKPEDGLTYPSADLFIC